MALAATGRKALDVAREFQPEVIVLDLGLPDMDGSAVLAGLREWTTGSFTVDLAAGTVTRQGHHVRLTPTEWHMLEVLAMNVGTLVSQCFASPPHHHRAWPGLPPPSVNAPTARASWSARRRRGLAETDRLAGPRQFRLVPQQQEALPGGDPGAVESAGPGQKIRRSPGT